MAPRSRSTRAREAPSPRFGGAFLEGTDLGTASLDTTSFLKAPTSTSSRAGTNFRLSSVRTTPVGA